MKTKKHVIFDFGGVLINLNFWNSVEELNKVMDLDLLDDANKPWFIQLFKDYEKGEAHDEQFLWNLQMQANGTPDPVALIKAWNAMILDIPKQRIEMLQKLKSNYQLSLLTNSNSLHVTRINKILKESHSIHDLDVYFDHNFYSHRLGMRKPNEEIYAHVLHTLGAKPEDCLFIDDLSSNIAGAEKLGIRTAHHDPKTDITEVIDGYLEKLR